MNPSMMPLLLHASRQGEVSACNLTGREEELHSVSDVMTLVAADFARLGRRSMPFLARYRSRLVASAPGVLASQDVPRMGGEPPNHCLMLSTGKGNGWVGVWINAAAITVILEGALGGSALFDSAPVPSEMTAPQRALVDRVTRSLLTDLIAAIQSQTGLKVTGEPKKSLVVESDAMYVVCEVENLSIPAAVIIAASSEVLAQASDARAPVSRDEHNPDMLMAIRDVEVELVAELGRVTMSLRRAMNLTVGDVIRLNTADDDSICVRVGEIPKFGAVPVTSRGQMAIEIRSRHGR